MMEHTFDFDGGPEDVLVRTSGSATQKGFVELITELTAHPRFRPGLAIVVDHTELDLGPLSNDDIRGVARTTKAVEQQLQSALLVVVAPTLLGFALSRMWESLVDELALETRVVGTRAEAREWIRQRRGGS
jgi:hypothetical protein